jgi:RNA-directed DNA polymerase
MTTEAVRRAIQHSQESVKTLVKRYRINQKTVASSITNEAVDALGLKAGSKVKAIIKPSDGMVAADKSDQTPTAFGLRARKPSSHSMLGGFSL